MAVSTQSIEHKAVNAIRVLTIDAVERAGNGHPGMPMGAAPMGYTLYAKHMKHNPANPEWFNRDRFVLSAGHGSMLLYSLLHLCGYDLPIEEIQNLRQWGSKTPGHPEYGHTPGVDATTGPLGQGVAMAVGIAMAEAHLGGVYNKEGFPLVDHNTYVICGDGDMMEGVASEASSMAGHLKLGKLIMLYDSNDISLDGDLNMSFSESVQKRYEAYGWQYLRVEDQHDLDALSRAVEEAKGDLSRPTLIEVKTTIGYGSPNRAGVGGKSGPHGNALSAISPEGKNEIPLSKRFLGWPEEPDFYIPEDVYAHYAQAKERGAQAEAAWNRLLEEYRKAYPELAAQFEQSVSGQLPEGWDAALPVYEPADKALATRAASGNALNAIAKTVPFLIGGSADLAGSNNTEIKGAGDLLPGSYAGRNIWFGVREFAMGAAMNGMMLHKGLKVYGGTFFVFSDYLRPAIRLSAIMQQAPVYILTHDSIGVGEDGPTHEPIEQLPAIRVIPGITVFRPADANETTEAWRYAMNHQDGPIAMILTRQNVPVLEGTRELAREHVARGAYVLADADNGKPQLQLLATGSEVSLALEAKKKLAAEGIQARVVSMPSWELFEKQPQSYKDSVILPDVKARLAVEMAYPLGWERYVGDGGAILGINRFGASAPGPKIIAEYGFTADNVAAQAKALLA